MCTPISSYPAWIDLHLHIDGSISPKTARKLAGMQGISLPDTAQTLQQRMSVMANCMNLNEYLERFQLPCSLLHIREALYLCTFELLDELYEQGLQYAEIRFAPQKSCLNGLTQYEVVEIVLRAMADAPIPAGLIISMMRGDDNSTQNLVSIEVARHFMGKGVVAVDLAGAEALFPNSLFAEEFAAVHRVGIPLIIHAGEAAGAESVREAILAGAVRIGHGVRSLEDPDVVQMLAERQILLELCPTSNLNTGIFHSYDQYPLRQLMDAGVHVSINTDNMTVSNTTLAAEWQHMTETFRLTDDEIHRILSHTIDACFAPEAVKASLRAQLPLIR